MKLSDIPQGLLVFLGGGTGATLRWLLSVILAVDTATQVWIINLIGAFLLGFFLSFLSASGEDNEHRQALRLLIGTGLMGGFTTYSSFSVETIKLAQQNLWGGFALSIGATLTLGLLCCWFGTHLGSYAGTQYRTKTSNQ
ncbi:fluoride efflux transporter FluC [Rothia sp. P6271]|uniref:fluoride efflux transporter FluC n=1 Tax=unclassified Rothia (in: high G+C Gram-positive bacteria) TaxID=2689056 RepID=UPI003AC3586A